MTTYIGRIGDMIPIGCLSSMAAETEQRVTVGGGLGTLSPRRVRVHGAGARTWAASRGVGDFAAANAVVNLARAQSRLGGAYRVIPCDATDHNMLTPQASEDLTGWTNVTRGWRASFPEVDGAWADSIIPLTIPFVIGGTGGLMAAGPRPSTLGKIGSGQTATSPLTPVVRPGQVFPAAYLSGSGTLRLRTYDGEGASESSTVTFTGAADVLQRVVLPTTPAEGRVSMRIEVLATGGDVHIAWPSLAYKPNPYATGRGCDAAWISAPSRDVIGTWGAGLESHAFQIVEVGV